jgi:hypothetical protein
MCYDVWTEWTEREICYFNVTYLNWSMYLLYRMMTLAPSGLLKPTDLTTVVWVNFIRVEPLDINLEKCPMA